MLFKKREQDIFQEPEYDGYVPISEKMVITNQKNVMLSYFKGLILTYSKIGDYSYEVMLCQLKDKTNLAPLVELTPTSNRSVRRVVSRVKSLLSDEDAPLDYLDPEEIESSYTSISKENNRLEVKFL